MLRLSVLCLTVLLLAGCDSAAPDLSDSNDFSLRVGGAIKADFSGDAVETQAAARIITRPDGNQNMLLKLEAVRRTNGKEVIQLNISYEFDGAVTPGQYYVADINPENHVARARSAYALDSSEVSSRYVFEGRALVLEIVRIDGDYVAGRLNVQSEQLSGQRRLYNQWEEVTLAGSVGISATFEAPILAAE